jgi:hypothetical protein
MVSEFPEMKMKHLFPILPECTFVNETVPVSDLHTYPFCNQAVLHCQTAASFKFHQNITVGLLRFVMPYFDISIRAISDKGKQAEIR